MRKLQGFISSAREHLPSASFLQWASLFFSLSVLAMLVSLAASQAFLAVAAVTYAVYLFRHRPAIAFPPLKLPLALFITWTVLSTFWADNPAAGGFAIRKLVLFVILLLAVNLIASAARLERLWQVLFVEAATAGLLGTWQFVMQYRAVRAAHPHHIYLYMTDQRITGFMGHWMNFGGQQMLVFMMFLACLLLRPRTRALWWLVAAVVAFSILLNFTRGVWLGCFVGGLYIVARWRPRWLWVVPALGAVIFLASPRLVRERTDSVFHPSSDPSIAVRFEMWKVGWRMIQKHPWMGVGPNNINEDYVLYLPPGKCPIPGYHEHLHNDYIQFAAERGLPCLAAWLWFMLAILVYSLRIRRKRNAARWMVDGVIAAWLAFMVEGIFEFNFGTSPVLMVFLFVASTPVVVAQDKTAQDPGLS